MSQATPFERIGGAEVVRALAARFYALLDADPDYAELRALHGADLEPIRESLALFLQAWLGGPRDWFEARPGTCIMRLHRAMSVTPVLAGQWSDAMLRSIAADPRIDPALARQLGEALDRMAFAMVPRPEMAAG
ncbi:globin [Sphingomonas sp. dw_22]|uniref:globin domain-containing protein n=1 Tax=Sphingomonas sp. dw_22 TaxID=2721175 RepID=UPI001BD5322B|nr:globin [Sphingomonas sp. dw_22]